MYEENMSVDPSLSDRIRRQYSSDPEYPQSVPEQERQVTLYEPFQGLLEQNREPQLFTPGVQAEYSGNQIDPLSMYSGYSDPDRQVSQVMRYQPQQNVSQNGAAQSAPEQRRETQLFTPGVQADYSASPNDFGYSTAPQPQYSSPQEQQLFTPGVPQYSAPDGSDIQQIAPAAEQTAPRAQRPARQRAARRQTQPEPEPGYIPEEADGGDMPVSPVPQPGSPLARYAEWENYSGELSNKFVVTYREPDATRRGAGIDYSNYPLGRTEVMELINGYFYRSVAPREGLSEEDRIAQTRSGGMLGFIRPAGRGLNAAETPELDFAGTRIYRGRGDTSSAPENESEEQRKRVAIGLTNLPTGELNKSEEPLPQRILNSYSVQEPRSPLSITPLPAEDWNRSGAGTGAGHGENAGIAAGNANAAGAAQSYQYGAANQQPSLYAQSSPGTAPGIESALNEIAGILGEISDALNFDRRSSADGIFGGLPSLADELARLIHKSSAREYERGGWY